MKKIKVKINGVWEDKIAINGSTSGFSYQSWLNSVAVRNGTKTTIEAGDIDFSKLTGANVLRTAYRYCDKLTSIYADFTLMSGVACMTQCFYGSLLLTNINISFPSLTDSSTLTQCFPITVTTCILRGMSNSTVWASTSGNSNIFVQIGFCQNLTITCDILPNLYLGVMTSLNLASVVQVLGQLFNYAGLTAHTITFNRSFTGLSAGDYALIDAAKTTAVARNWTVAGLTYSM